MDKYYITEYAFEKIFLYVSGKNSVHCKNREKTRKFLEAVYFIMSNWHTVDRASKILWKI